MGVEYIAAAVATVTPGEWTKCTHREVRCYREAEEDAA